MQQAILHRLLALEKASALSATISALSRGGGAGSGWQIRTAVKRSFQMSVLTHLSLLESRLPAPPGGSAAMVQPSQVALVRALCKKEPQVTSEVLQPQLLLWF